MRLRVCSKDGNHYAITHDLKFDRINVDIVNNIVVKADIG